MEVQDLRAQLCGALARCKAVESQLSHAQAEHAGLEVLHSTTQQELQVMQRRSATLGLKLAQARQQLKSLLAGETMHGPGHSRAVPEAENIEDMCSSAGDAVLSGNCGQNVEEDSEQRMEDELRSARALLAQAQADTAHAEKSMLDRDGVIQQLQEDLRQARAAEEHLKQALQREQDLRQAAQEEYANAQVALDSLSEQLQEQCAQQAASAEAALQQTAHAEARTECLSQQVQQLSMRCDEAEQAAGSAVADLSAAEARLQAALDEAQSDRLSAQSVAEALSHRLSEAEADKGRAQVLTKRALAECAAAAQCKAEEILAMQRQLASAEARAAHVEEQLLRAQQQYTEAWPAGHMAADVGEADGSNMMQPLLKVEADAANNHVV
jgi:chromosome segregation ATPase